jgi:phospholipid/cholesterol/gamma-HCH transport system ATP-binding protein
MSQPASDRTDPSDEAAASASAGDAFIEVRGLHKAFGEQQILAGVDLDVERGETLVVVGRSGEGKSVLLKHLIGLMVPDEGSIRVDGDEIVGVKERKLSPIRKKMGVLFQDGALFDSMNVAENVAFPLIEKGIRKRSLLMKKVETALAMVDLTHHMEKMPIDISGGMRKRVALARAIITKPAAILYDEPTSGLDPIVSDSIDRLICRLQKRLGVTSIVVTHDMKSVFHIADRVAYLREGGIYFLGTPKEFRESKDSQIQDFVHGRSQPYGGDDDREKNESSRSGDSSSASGAEPVSKIENKRKQPNAARTTG